MAIAELEYRFKSRRSHISQKLDQRNSDDTAKAAMREAGEAAADLVARAATSYPDGKRPAII